MQDHLSADMRIYIWSLCPLVSSVVCKESFELNEHAYKTAKSAFVNWYVSTRLYRKNHDMFAEKFKCIITSKEINSLVPSIVFKIGRHRVVRIRRHMS